MPVKVRKGKGSKKKGKPERKIGKEYKQKKWERLKGGNKKRGRG